MLKQLNNLAESSLKNLQAAFDSGKMSTALKIAQELLIISGGFQDPTRYQISAYHYLSLIHVSLGRHDRAVCNVSRLVRLSKGTEDVVQICQSFVTLGKVHLSFGHLDAAAKAWEHLSRDLKSPIPVAWIRHEIGRCYLETGKYRRSAELAFKCVEAATKANSKKWMLNGRLLLGQSLAKLGRFVESLEELQIAAKITEEEGDTPMLSYIRDLIDQVARTLNGIPYQNCWEVFQSKICARQKDETEDHEVIIKHEETIISGIYQQRTAITEHHGDSSDDETTVDGDAEITMRSNETISLVQSYRDTTARSDIEEQSSPVQGSSTFKMESKDAKEEEVSSSSSSSSNSTSSFSDIDEEYQDVEEGIVSDGKGTDDILEEEEDEEVEARESNSQVSLKSANTTATYVIEDESLVEEVKCSMDNDGGWIEGNEKEATKTMMYNDKIVDQSEGMLNALRVIEELGKKDEVELLQMLRDMMLTTDEKDRSEDFGNSGDGFRTSRSEDDTRKKIATGEPIRRMSLPSSVGKFDAHGDFQDRGTVL